MTVGILIALTAGLAAGFIAGIMFCILSVRKSDALAEKSGIWEFDGRSYRLVAHTSAKTSIAA